MSRRAALLQAKVISGFLAALESNPTPDERVALEDAMNYAIGHFHRLNDAEDAEDGE